MDKQHTKRVKKKRNGEKAIKFRCDYSSTPLKVLESRGWTRIYDPKDRRWDLWWCDCSEIKLALDNFQRLRAQQRVAHFLNHGELTRKNLLYRNLRRYKRLLLKAGKSREAELCDIMPVSFELPSEYRMLVEEYRRCQGTTWIVKPAAGSQGRGIFLFQRLKDLAEWRSREYPAPSADSNSDSESLVPPDIYIVQKYIDDPYLLGGCKFDLRIYVLVTSFQPLKVWLAREGFARLSGEQFSLERINDSRVHLTNMSIQLKAGGARQPPNRAQDKAQQLDESSMLDYEQTRPPAKLGSKWPLSCLRQYLTERHGSAAVDDLLHNIAVKCISLWLSDLRLKMRESVSFDRDNDREMPSSVSDSGNLLLNSLQTHLPSVDASTDENEEDDIQKSTDDLQKVLLKPPVAHHSSEASHTGSTLALESLAENVNTENESSGTNVTSETCSEEINCIGRQVPVERPVNKLRNGEKTLRIGWLDKAAPGAKYRKVAKPRGGVKKLKLDATACYSACQIRRLAVEAFEASSDGGHNRAIEQEYVVNLGDFGGRAISDFKRRDGRVCNIWDYCNDSGKTLYQLDLFMLTSPIDAEEGEAEERCTERRTISTRRTKARPRIVANDLRVLYQYVRASRYSGELSYTECEKPELYARLFEDQCGDCPAIENFEPSDFGYSIARIVKSGQVLLQISVDDNGTKSIEFAESLPVGSRLEEHGIVHDVDQLQGYCNRKFGLGFVPSCSYACRPIFSWYKDGRLFRSNEYLYWLDDVKDDQPHLWSCTVSCSSSGRLLKSKEISVDGL